MKRGWFYRWRRDCYHNESCIKRQSAFVWERRKREALDAVASALDRDRSYVINEAIEAYLDIHRWQMVTSARF